MKYRRHYAVEKLTESGNIKVRKEKHLHFNFDLFLEKIIIELRNGKCVKSLMQGSHNLVNLYCKFKRSSNSKRVGVEDEVMQW